MANTDLLIEYVQELVDFPGDMAIFSCRERVEDLVAKILIHADLITVAVSNEYKDLEGPQFFSVFWGVQKALWPYEGERITQKHLLDIKARLPQVSTLSDVLNFELRDMLKAAELASLKDDKTIDLLHAKFTDHMRKEEGFLSAHSYRKQREIEAGYDQTRNNQAVLAGTPVENPQRTWMDDMYPVLIGVDPIRENPPVVMLNSSLTDIGDHKVEEGQVVQEFTIKLPKTDLPDGKVIVTVLTKDTQITDGAPRDFNDPLVQKFFTSNKE